MNATGQTFLIPRTEQPARPPLERLAGGFLAGYSSPKTREAYKADLTAWFAYLHAFQVDLFDVKRPVIDTYMRELEAQGLANNTRARRLGTVRSNVRRDVPPARYNGWTRRCVNTPGPGRPPDERCTTMPNPTCPVCGLECKSFRGRTNHMRAQHDPEWRDTCSVEVCDRPTKHGGLCNSHADWKRVNGVTPTHAIAEYDPAERFAEVVDKQEGGCWVWNGDRFNSGYGRIWDGERQVVAHRWSYEHHVGPIPDGLELDHLCRVRACVNPQHLDPVTHRINVLRGTSDPAVNVLKTACKHGHPYSDGNVLWQQRKTANRPTRVCRTCEKNRRDRRRAAARKGQS